MIPAQINIPTWRNSDYSEEFLITASGLPIDITSKTFVMNLRLFPLDATVALSVSIAKDIANSSILIFISADQLNTLFDVSDTYSFDIVSNDANNLREIYAQGILSINAGVTSNG